MIHFSHNWTSQCCGVTKSGSRCEHRRRFNGCLSLLNHWYCWQHRHLQPQKDFDNTSFNAHKRLRILLENSWVFAQTPKVIVVGFSDVDKNSSPKVLEMVFPDDLSKAATDIEEEGVGSLPQNIRRRFIAFFPEQKNLTVSLREKEGKSKFSKGFKRDIKNIILSIIGSFLFEILQSIYHYIIKGLEIFVHLILLFVQVLYLLVESVIVRDVRDRKVLNIMGKSNRASPFFLPLSS